MAVDADPIHAISAGEPCPGCGATAGPVVDEMPPDEGDDEEGGWAMKHDPDCPVLERLTQLAADLPDEDFVA